MWLGVGPFGIFKMTAVDQRPPIKGPIARHLGVEEAPWDDVARFKRMLVETLQTHSTAMLLDPHFAIPSSFDVLTPDKGLIVTLEDSLFEETAGGRLSADIDDWSVSKIKRMGADAVKVLAWYRPDAEPGVCRSQQDLVKRIGEECVRFDIPFLFELLVYPLPGDADRTKGYQEMKGKNSDHVLASVAEFAGPDYAIDVFKLRVRSMRKMPTVPTTCRAFSTRWVGWPGGPGSCSQRGPVRRSSRISSPMPSRPVRPDSSLDAPSGWMRSIIIRIGRRSTPDLRRSQWNT